MHGMNDKAPRPRATLGVAAAMAAALSGTPAVGLAGIPVPATPAVDTHTPLPSPLTRARFEAAMREAQRRRAELMRPDPDVPDSVEQQWGVEVIRLASSADGYWLDFRFRVTDVEKALPLFDGRINPYTQSDESGLRLGVPTAAKVGALRTTDRGGNIKPDKIYTIIFSNPGRHVKPGQKVSLVIGHFKLEHLSVN